MLNGRVAVVTGGSRGIGAATARELAARGADLALIYAGNAQAAQETCEVCRALGVRAEAWQCDVADYAAVKAEVMAVKRQIDAACDITPVPCHNDVLCENWVVSAAGKMYLIDWEYAGMNDGIWDVADLSIEAVYDHTLDEALLRAYLGREPETMDWKHFLANKLYVDYLWTLWAKARVPYDGQPMEDWAAERYARLKENLLEFQQI